MPAGSPPPAARPTLRPYQRDAIAAVIAARRRGVRRILVQLPTGAGKTVIFSELARLARRPVLVLAHRRELVQQARDKLARALGDGGIIAVEQAGDTADAGARVVVASIRSLHEARLARLLAHRRFGLVVYDECHHAPAADNRRVLGALGAFDDDWDGTLLGVTATTTRADGVGLDAVFEELVYRCSIADLVAAGYLAPLRGYRIATAADLAGVTAGRGDFDVDELAEAIDIESRNALVARSIQELARDRRTIAFCVTVAHARRLARALQAIGVPCGIVHGAQDADTRSRTLRDFAAGRLAAVTNVGVLTEGFDDPGVSCVAMARPTRSAGLYAQCIGRGTRIAPGKTDCLVLDFVDLSALSLVTLPSLAGLPPDLDLRGERLDEARHRLQAIWDRDPGFEIAPGAITLDEIQRRAAAFDPLTQQVSADVRAISRLAWQSLGSRGLALHACWGRQATRRGRVSEVLVLDRGGRVGSRRWEVRVDGREVARFSRVEEAVEAVEFEISRRGPAALDSATPDAAWRRAAVPPDLARQLRARLPHHHPADLGDAWRLWSWARHGPRNDLRLPAPARTCQGAAPASRSSQAPGTPDEGVERW